MHHESFLKLGGVIKESEGEEKHGEGEAEEEEEERIISKTCSMAPRKRSWRGLFRMGVL